MKKFEEHRSVNSRYWTIPVKYCLEIQNSKTYSYKTTEFNKELFEKVLDSGGNIFDHSFKKDVYHKAKKLDFVIMDSMGKNLVCAWRNHYTGRIGRPFLCPKIKKRGKLGLLYKDKFYSLENRSGWVL